jgi:hypothetical protein
LLNSSTATAYVKSTSIVDPIQFCKLKNFGRQCRCHSRSSQFWTCYLEARRTGQFFPIHSWVDLRHVCDPSPSVTFHFRDYRTYFCLPPTSPVFPFTIFLIPGTFHPRRWPQATCLSMLTSLRELRLEFESPQSCPDQENRRSPPPTRSVLPALTRFEFIGVNEYLEELVARIDTPRLRCLWTTFFNDIDFDTPELIQFITLTFGAPKGVDVVFDSRVAWVTVQPQEPLFADNVMVQILCRVPGWQLSFLAQICTSLLPFFSTTENLYIHEFLQSQLDWNDGIENIEWLELLLPFTAVKDLYLSKQFAPRIAPALQELTGGRIEALPTLQNIFLEGFEPSEPVHEGIEQFISARQLTNCPVAISVWNRPYML